MEFKESIEKLKILISSTGRSIENHSDNGTYHQLKTADGAIVNWYPSTGTVQFQGKPEAKKQLQETMESVFSDNVQGKIAVPASVVQRVDSQPEMEKSEIGGNKIFVVHGHDSTSRKQLELIIHRLGLNPFVLANTAGGGLTIIEALEKEMGPSRGTAKFGIVLLTPDDMGYEINEGQDKAQPRARQNVVLEMGMLIAAIGRENVAILKKGHIEVPSDAQGILYIPYNNHVKETVPRIVDRLTRAGFELDPSCINDASCWNHEQFSVENEKSDNIYRWGMSGQSRTWRHGTVLLYKLHRKELKQGFRKTTNNRMELMAAIAGLQELNWIWNDRHLQKKSVTVRSNQKYYTWMNNQNLTPDQIINLILEVASPNPKELQTIDRAKIKERFDDFYWYIEYCKKKPETPHAFASGSRLHSSMICCLVLRHRDILDG